MTKKLLSLVFLLAPAWVFAQGWVGNGSSALRAVNSTPTNTPIQVGVGIAPLTRFHVSLSDLPVPQRNTLGIRFEALNQNNTYNRVLVTDAAGNLLWRDASTIGTGNEWLLLGNTLTNPATNFLGTIDNQNLVFRTNNQHRIMITGGLPSTTPGSTGGFVGIGLGTLVSPLARVHANGGLLFTGTTTSAPIPALGGGQRVVWYPDKAAFRAGSVGGSQWDGANVGNNSFGIGTNTTASGLNSFAGGNISNSTGMQSFAFGSQATASGTNAVALGQQNNASGSQSFALGSRVISAGGGSFVLGNGGATALTNSIANSMMIGFNSNLPTLFVGPSAGPGTTGNVGIGNNAASPTAKLDVDGTARVRNIPAGITTDQVMVADGLGNIRKLPFATLCAASPCGTPPASCWDCSGSFTFLNNLGHNVGIGFNTAPNTKLQVDGGGLFTGSVASPSIPALGAGQRMVWHPDKAAFRSGTVSGSQWDGASVGNNSFAVGNNTIASGTESAAFGSSTQATGTSSFAAGTGSIASGIYSTTFGAGNNSTGDFSFTQGASNTVTGSFSMSMGAANTTTGDYAGAFGTSNTTNGNYSFVFGASSRAGFDNSKTGTIAMGQDVFSDGNHSIALGNYVSTGSTTDNSIVLGSGTSSLLTNNISRSLMVGFDSDIPTLFVGPSAGNGTTGNVGIGNSASSPTAKLDVDGTTRVRTLPAGTTTDEVVIADTDGNLRKLPFASLCAASPCGAASSCWNCTLPGITYLSNLGDNVGIGTATPSTKLHATGGALFTGNAGEPIPTNGDGRRMMWYPGKAAFRAGAITGGFGQWDDTWIGEYSFASGQNTRANGTYSFATGNNATANGTSSFTSGENTIAGDYSFATGQNNSANNYSFVAGQNCIAAGTGSFAVGTGAYAGGTGAAAFGAGGTIATGNYSLASGTSAQATGNYSVAFGNGSFATGQSAFSLGQSVSSNGQNSFASGVNASTSGNNSFLCGNGTNIGSNGHGAVALGYQNYANGENSFVMGNISQATGNLSFAAGFNCQANAENAVALGRTLRANASFSTVFGMGGINGLANNISQSIMMGTGSDSASLYIGPSYNPFSGTGRVGIGTSNPQDKLDINGNVVPHFDAAVTPYTLGTPTLRWQEVFAANGTINTSDARQKTNVQDLNYGLNEIKQLRPVTFNWINNQAAGTKVGLIAQEVKEVISEVVKEGNDPNQTLGLYYSDLIPVLIKGIQEQQVLIETLEAKIETLENSSFASSSEKTLQTINGMAAEVVKVYQNNPNPFDEITEIKFFIPEQVSEAKLYIYNLSGTELKSISIKERGASSVQINGGELAAGMYLYTIIADGEETETKRMILTK